jgi:hypothetical protein
MRRSLLALLATTSLCVGGLLVSGGPANSAPPAPGDDWAPCGGAVTEYCVISRTRNGVPVSDSDTYYPYAHTLDNGTVGFGVWHNDGGSPDGDVPPGDTYTLVVDSGPILPRELYANARNVTFSRGGGAGAYTFTLSFRPTPIHHLPGGCVIGACGGSTTRASLDYDGFVTGYVTDLASSGLDAAEISQRTGMISAYNAQDANTYYDPDSNSLVVQLANPHLTGSGALATGSYETFLPTAFLEGTMNVPDASTLSAGTVEVVRTAGGATSSAPFTLTHVAGGIRISITGITYSSPTYRLHPGPSKPRKMHASKISTHRARVRFMKPANTLGRKINRYQARCHKPGKAWRSTKGTASPLTVGRLPKGKVYCQVRAHNKLGWGIWSPVKHT